MFGRNKDWRGIAMRYDRCHDLFMGAMSLKITWAVICFLFNQQLILSVVKFRNDFANINSKYSEIEIVSKLSDFVTSGVWATRFKGVWAGLGAVFSCTNRNCIWAQRGRTSWCRISWLGERKITSSLNSGRTTRKRRIGFANSCLPRLKIWTRAGRARSTLAKRHRIYGCLIRSREPWRHSLSRGVRGDAGGAWRRIGYLSNDAEVSVPPFEEISFSLSELWEHFGGSSSDQGS